jgi:hypothetical protein
MNGWATRRSSARKTKRHGVMGTAPRERFELFVFAVREF